MNTVEIKFVDEQQIRRHVDTFAAGLLLSYQEIVEIIVFGSFSTGKFVPGSDIDVLILLSDSDKPVRDRVSDFMPSQFPVSMDVFPYTILEFAALEHSPITKAAKHSRWRYRRS